MNTTLSSRVPVPCVEKNTFVQTIYWYLLAETLLMNFLGSLWLVWEQKNRHVSRVRSTNCFGCSAAWSTAEAVRNLVKNVAADWSGVGHQELLCGFCCFFIADLIICGLQTVVAALSCSSSGSKSAQGAKKVVASCLLPLPQCLIWGQFKWVQKEPVAGQQSLALVQLVCLQSLTHPIIPIWVCLKE